MNRVIISSWNLLSRLASAGSPTHSTVKSITLGGLIQRKQRLRLWGKVRSEIFLNGFYATLRQAWHVARMGERRGEYSVLVEKLEERRPLGRTRRRWKVILKLIYKCDGDVVAYPGILFGRGGGVQQIQLGTEDSEKGDLGEVVP